MKYSPRKVLGWTVFFTVISLTSIGLLETAALFVIIFGMFVTYKIIANERA